MIPKLERWNALRIQKAARDDLKTVVTLELGQHRALSFRRAMNLTGTYMVQETTHEIIVQLDTHKKDGQ